MSDQFWLGPTYEFHSGEWILTAGIPAGESRLEWLLERDENGKTVVSHSFVLDPGATREDLESALADLSEPHRSDLVNQAMSQSDPRLLATDQEAGLA